MRLALSLLTLLLIAGPVQGLTLLEDRTEPEHRTLRLALEEGGLRARAVTGTPSLADRAMDSEWTVLQVEEAPWRGFERTVVVQVAGHGQVVVADEVSGLVFDAPGRANDTGNASRPGTDPRQPPEPKAGGNHTAPGSNEGAGAVPVEDPAGGHASAALGTSRSDPGRVAPATVGLGVLALAMGGVALAGPLRRAVAALGWTVKRLRR